MDGVPHVTQHPIKTGARFEYAFSPPDSGTFWYHPHQNSFEQVPRGLYGALIVEEEKPIEVDREELWVLSDIKLGPDGRLWTVATRRALNANGQQELFKVDPATGTRRVKPGC